jgi:hypothetical protein
MAPHRSLRRATLGLAVVAGVMVMVIVGALASVAGETPAPTVTFTATGVPPLSCGSTPNVGSLNVPEGTGILLENRIGVSAWVRVGSEDEDEDQQVIEVPDGTGALLVLAVGQYAVGMVPECLHSGQAKPVTVTVTRAQSGNSAQPANSTQAPTPDAVITPDSAMTSPAPSTRASSIGSPADSSAEPVGSGGVPEVVPVGAQIHTQTPAPNSSRAPFGRAVIEVSPVELQGAGNPKGVRLLAIVAAICVLGVTTAIIRSIVRLGP